MTVSIPNGYRHVTDKEFYARRSACMDLDAADEDDAWDDLEHVTLWDGKQHLSISSAPYFWRVFVEPESEVRT